MNTRFLQIHTLTSYPGALLNRDDVGFAKRLPFGGTTRTRVSSQCLKRHWRTHVGEHSLSGIDAPMSVRSRLTFERYVVEPLVGSGLDEKVARAVTETIMGEVLGKSAKAAAKTDGEEDARTGQITVLGRPEIDYLLETARSACKAAGNDAKKARESVKGILGKDGRKNLKAMRCAAGLDASMFGRMVTSDILARGDAALHVAHAFTVHEEESESDYFSAVDDLLRGGDEEELGSGHIGTTELTSGLFYGYVVVDVPLLVSNVEGCSREAWDSADPTLASEVVRRMVHLVATVSPGAKLGSTAPHSYAHLVMIESGSAQPRTLANAFLRPVRGRPDLVQDAYAALAAHLTDLDRMYGTSGDRRHAAIGPVDTLESVAGAHLPALGELASWASGQVGER